MNTADKNAGKKWPWIIGLSIVAVIGFSVATVKVAINNPVEMSEYGMQSYHTYDDNANDIINAKVAFDKNYTISFLTPQIVKKGAVIVYKITDKSNKVVNDAKVDVVLTRPDTTKLDLNLTSPTINNGIYTFSPVDLPNVGRWDILAKVSIGDNQRYYNLKADTRNPNTFEF
ncbi:MAG: FixH family protein [Campylobacterales bacterium]|nr:FixH family protein [Campylobacterales bacterium]